MENFSGKRVITLRSDNGGEYTSHRFKEHLKACGVRHEFSIPRTPEQNGVAEHLNRTLVEATRSMLLDANLPQQYWAEAVNTAAYLRNRSSTSTVKGMTPYQAWYGRKPGVKHLRVFGCEAYAHVSKERRRKLDSKTQKSLMMGYGNIRKGYRLRVKKTGNIIFSQNVVFNETERTKFDDNSAHQPKHQTVVLLLADQDFPGEIPGPEEDMDETEEGAANLNSEIAEVEEEEESGRSQFQPSG